VQVTSALPQALPKLKGHQRKRRGGRKGVGPQDRRMAEMLAHVGKTHLHIQDKDAKPRQRNAKAEKPEQEAGNGGGHDESP
jgi:hypothetical protein